jgi:transposase
LPPEATQRVQQLLRRRATLVRAAVTVRQSLSDLPGFKREVRTLLARFDRLAQQIQAQILEKLKASDWIDDHRRCQGIEGVGPLSAAALCATFHRGAFTSADAFIAYLGLDVCVRQSGTQNARGTLSKKGDPEVRRLLHNAAMAASRSATWKPFYQACIARGFSCTQALVALARKIARVAFSLMKTSTQYQPGGHKNTCAQT